MRRPRAFLAAPLLLTALVACTDSGPSDPGAEDDSHASGSPSPRADGGLPEGGSSGAPAPLDPETALLDWRPAPGSVDDTVTVSGAWTLTVDEAGVRAELSGPAGEWVFGSRDERVSDALIDGGHAVVVLQDRAEMEPSRAFVTDLSTGEQLVRDGSSDVPTTNGGTWALFEGRLLHATIGPGRAYCLAEVNLATGTDERGWCAPKRTGFASARATPFGTSMLTFDDSQPACRTVVAVDGPAVRPFEQVPDCAGWDGLLTGRGVVWTEIPDEQRIEQGVVRAAIGDAYYDLGPASAGTLTWCGDAAWFARDPQRDGEPAQLLRWHEEDGLTVAYESPGGQAFLTAPRCGGDAITVTALAEDGDEQVYAELG